MGIRVTVVNKFCVTVLVFGFWIVEGGTEILVSVWVM